MNTNAIKSSAITFSRMGAFCIVLALALTACESRESGELDDAEAAEIDQGVNEAYGGAPMMRVSIIETGEMVPTVPAGRATFTVDGAMTDCDLTLTPRAGGTSQGTMGQSTRGRDATGQGTMRQETRSEDGLTGEMEEGAADVQGEDDGTRDAQDDPRTQTGADRTGANQGGAMQGDPLTAGPSETVTVDLEPGLYEVSCVGNQIAEQEDLGQQNGQETNELGQNQNASPMLVMVTEEVSAGLRTPGTTDPESGGLSGEDDLGTDN